MDRNNPVGGANAERCPDGYTQLQWADYALGSVPARLAEQMIGHVQVCPVCAARLAEWGSLLLSDAEPEAGTGRLYPSDRHRRALVRAVKLTGFRRRLLRKPYYWGSALAAVGLLLLLLAGLLRQDTAAEPDARFVELREPAAMQVMQAPDTAQYRVMLANRPGSGDGFVWVSGDASEALLLLDGLPALERADYQAWAIAEGRRMSLGLLKISGTKAHLHVRTTTLRTTENITLSAEPKGGSPQPTTDETVLVVFANR